MHVQWHYKLDYVTFRMTSVWSDEANVSPRPICHDLTKQPFGRCRTVPVMGLAVAAQVLDDL